MGTRIAGQLATISSEVGDLSMNISYLSRRFHLERVEDASGVSGTGVVAQGVEWSNGSVTLCWLTAVSSICVYANMHAVEVIHGHGGRTRVVWDDPVA